MPAQDSPAIIVARFLKANHYNDTLDAFIREAGLPSEAGTAGKDDLTIEKILEEKKIFDISTNIERTGVDEKHRAWSLPAPSYPTQVALPSSANLLHVSIEPLWDDSSQCPRQMLYATTADRHLTFVNINDLTIWRSLSHVQDSPILACLPLGASADSISISCSMSGQVVIYNHKADKVVEARRDHKKYVIKIAICPKMDRPWIATAGWDGKVYIYRVENPTSGLGPPVAELTLPTNPEAVTFIQYPEEPATHILLVTRRDSTSLYFYRLPSLDASTLELLGTQNLAPHSNAWVAFSPSSVAVCPTDPTKVAVATSAVPHMKLIIVRLLLPPLNAPAGSGVEPTSQAAQTRASLAIQDKEDMAILVHVSTLAPQTPYSTPHVVWRPDGTGVWVNGDDGVLRGLETRTGKIVTSLRDGHEIGSKIRSVWCGNVDVHGRKEEWLVSGGFDRRLVVWKPKKEETG